MNTQYGPSDRVRTCGLMVPNHPRYQLRHTRLYLFFSLLPAYYLSAVRPRRFPQKHSRIIQGSQKGLPFWGEDKARNECGFAKGGNEWYGAAEDGGALAPLLVSSPRRNASIRSRRHFSSPNCAWITCDILPFLASFVNLGKQFHTASGTLMFFRNLTSGRWILCNMTFREAYYG